MFKKQCVALLICAVFSTAALAGGHKVVKPIVPIPVDPEVDAGVRATLAATEAAWNSQDFAKVLDLWDPEQEFPTYIAEEQAQWFVGCQPLPLRRGGPQQREGVARRLSPGDDQVLRRETRRGVSGSAVA